MEPIKLSNDKGLYAVPVPLDSKNHKLDYWLTCSTLLYPIEPHKGVPCNRGIFLGKGRFDILGYVTKDEISFNVAEYLEKNNQFTTAKFTVYNKEFTYTPNPEYSFHSLLLSSGLYFENPCGEKPKHYDEWKSELDKGYEHEYDAIIMKKWKQAEANLIEKLIILKKI